MEPVLEKKDLLPTQPGRKPGDVYIPNLFDGKPAALDVAITCPLREIYLKSEKLPADTYADEVKWKTYGEGFIGLNMDFCPVVFDNFGSPGTEGLSVLKEIIKRGAARQLLPLSTYSAQSWQRIAICIQRANARMIIKRLEKSSDEF